jgi:hypothetical protein
MSDPKNPKVGDLHIDASDISVIDYTPEFVKTLTKLRPGHGKAIDNLANLTPEQLAAAGINPAEVTAIVALAAERTHIGVLLAASEKMTELLHETHLDRGHRIATRLAEIVEQARRRADRSLNSAEILGPLDALIAYQLGPSQKATATKAKAKSAAKPGPSADPVDA